MGIQLLQDFIDSSASYSEPLPKYLGESKINTSNLLIVHADSCIRQLYHELIDWVCGGQWNELLQSVEKFVRAFRQSDIELIVFFDGSLNLTSLHNWSTKHRFFRDTVRETISHVINNQSVPFRTKTKNFVAPGALKSALRLAFRSLNVVVCCSLEDVYKESLLFGKDENCLGIIGSDANFFLSYIQRYIYLGSLRWAKKIFSACKVYNFEAILKELGLQVEQLPYLAALLGNFMINDSNLSSFYWELIEEDHPLKKLQVNLITEAVLPPTEVRLKCVSKFLHEKGDEVKDIKTLAKIVFSKSKNINAEDGENMLSSVIEYYKDCMKASSSSICSYRDENSGLTPGGFPSPQFLKDQSCLPRYKKKWKYVDKTKHQINAALPEVPKPKEVGDETEEKRRVENPEEVIKQGTLEEAAQALIQLEMNETGDKSGEEEKQEDAVRNARKSPIPSIANDEKPSISTDEIHLLESDSKAVDYPREILMKAFCDNIDNEVLQVARKRHQTGQMCPEVLNLLTKGEIILNLALDDEATTTRLPIPLIFRPLRQLVYGVLFGTRMEKENNVAAIGKEIRQNGILDDQKSSDEDEEKLIVEEVKLDVEEKEAVEENVLNGPKDVHDPTKDVPSLFSVKEWCMYGEKKPDEPDLVEPKGMSWGVPPLRKLWFGVESEDNANRLKAFLSCMKSDTVNMSNTAMVPQRLMLLCCVLRYLIQQDSTKAVLTKQDIDAFLAQALSTQLTIDHNTQNLANMKLSHIDSRCIQLAATFMNGIENAIIANDACGSPIPWEFCCPWNFFDGKLFHSKWLMSTMNSSATDLCDGKLHLAEKLERLRWCVVEGLDLKYTITGLPKNIVFNLFGTHINSAPFQGVLRPAGSYPPNQVRPRSRGAGSKRMVHGSGGTLHVAGVPISHWHGNKSGIGYSKNAPGVIVGGPNSVDLPSSHRRGRGRGRGVNRGRGLLQTPFLSPWQQGFGFEDYVNSTYHRYMKGVQKAEQVRMKVGKSNRGQAYASRMRNQMNSNNSGGKGSNIATSWFGKGRGHIGKQIGIPSVKPASAEMYGRGQWINTS